ncbi:MAG: methyltransferase domain-containing protein [Micromonosporaceae bacterium]|nr:methyltransferase domain-containing protein [Micromonosporaceae bacterium]
MLDEVLDLLTCPVCGARLGRAGSPGGLRCPAGHAFDVARHGYVNLLVGRVPAGTDTPAMVAARSQLHDAGHLAPLTAAIVAQLPPTVATVVDVGAGTGHHLAAVLAARPGSVGVAVDVSKAAARRNARAHPAIGSVVADVWRRLPLADACADVILDVFAPRNGAEFHRILRPGGTLLVVTPTRRHLAELIAPLGLLTVDPDKRDRLQGRLGRWFAPVRHHEVSYALRLARPEVARFVAMGPSAWHTTEAELGDRLAAMSEPVTVTISVDVTTWRPHPADA